MTNHQLSKNVCLKKIRAVVLLVMKLPKSNLEKVNLHHNTRMQIYKNGGLLKHGFRVMMSR